MELPISRSELQNLKRNEDEAKRRNRVNAIVYTISYNVITLAKTSDKPDLVYQFPSYELQFIKENLEDILVSLSDNFPDVTIYYHNSPAESIIFNWS
jgi:hypothetical protein